MGGGDVVVVGHIYGNSGGTRDVVQEVYAFAPANV